MPFFAHRLVATVSHVAVTAVLAAGAVALPAQVAGAEPVGSARLAWNEDGATQRTFGANATIMIFEGRINYTTGCPAGSNDAFSAWSNVFIVATGSATDGATLTDLSGASNAVQGASGGYFGYETIGATKPSGKLGAGVYDVVYDECQDGKFNAGVDSLFESAITVTMPTADVPPADPAIQAYKNAAGAQAVQWAKTHYAFVMLTTALELYKMAKCISNPIDCFVGGSALLGYATLATQHMLGVDNPKKSAVKALANQVKHYTAIYLDPPDPAFEQVTALGPVDHLPAETGDPIDVAVARLAAAASQEQALAEALLHSVERYQGADAADDGDWALAQARSMREYSDALATQVGRTSGALEALGAAFSADAVDLDDYLAQLESRRTSIETSGFSTPELQTLRNAGLDATEIAELRAKFTAESFDGDEALLVSQIAAQVAANDAAVAALADFEAETSAIISALESDPAVALVHPEGHAGGPYTAAEGSAVVLDASGTTAAPGASIASYAWDLDGDGSFDDATGVAPSHTFSSPRAGLVAVRVTDDDGWSDIATADIEVTEANAPPVLSNPDPVTGQHSVPVGSTTPLSVTTTDPEGDAVAVAWSVDGLASGTGTSFSYTAPATPSTEIVRAVAKDGPTGGTAVMSWAITAEAPDADGDGWNANADCLESDPAVPADHEVVGNGKDDDCDASTTDAGSAPTAAFTHTVTPGLSVTFADASTDPNDDIVAWAWNFGDGGSSDQPDPTHAYAAKGTYSVTLTVTDSGGGVDSETKDIVVASPPAASFTRSPDAPVAGSEVDFTDTSTDPDGTVEAWAWDFGDGGESAVQHPTHRFTAAGTYTVSLTVTDDDGATHTSSQDVVIGVADPGTAPKALFGTSSLGRDLAAAANGGAIVASSGTCCGGHEAFEMLDDSVGWPWATQGASGSFFATVRISTGAARTIDAVQVQPRSDGWFDQRVRDFAIDVSTTGFAAGDFTNVLNATAADSGSLQTFALPPGTMAKYVRYRPLNNRGGCCNISTSKLKVLSASSGPRKVTFQNQSSNATTYKWTFGDGATSTAANPTHTYAVIGTYSVKLVARAADGRTSEYTRVYEARGPTAGFTITPATPVAGEPATFTDSTLSPTAAPTSFAWDFGDGTLSDSAGTLHTFKTAGVYAVTHAVTDAEGNTDAVTKSITVVDATSPAAPRARFSPSAGSINVASSTGGATVHSSSGQYNSSYPTSTLLDEDSANTYWATPNGSKTGWVKVDLAGDLQRVDRIRIAGDGGAERVRAFTVSVSATGSDDASFTQVLSATSPNDDTLREYVFPGGAVTARYVRLDLLSNWGSSCCVGVDRLDVLTGPAAAAGRNLAIAGTGATIHSYSSRFADYHDPGTLIDGDATNNWWATQNGTTSGWVKIDLAGDSARMIDRILVQPRAGDQRVRDVEIAVSTTGAADADFISVARATLPHNDNLAEVFLPYPMPAKYVRYRAINNRGSGCCVSTNQIRVLTGQESASATVRFRNLSAGATSYAWDFGDGTSSTEESPSHTFPGPGTYDVTLTATNAHGTSTFVLQQTIREPSFAYSPAAPEAHERIDLVDTTPAELGVVAWAWDFGDGTASAFRNPVKTYSAPGSYPVTLTGTDRDGNPHVSRRVITVAPASFRAMFQPRGAYNVAGLENGAAIISFSSQYDCCTWNAPKLLDHSHSTAWHSSGSPAQSTKEATFSLAGGATYQLDRFQLLGRQDCCFDQHPRDFEIAVSTTGTAAADFSTVLRDTLAAGRTSPQTFLLPRPVQAKYVRYRTLNTRGAGVVTTAALRAGSGQASGLTVTFDDLTVGGAAPLTYAWDFGDGSAPSSEASPTHTFPAPGTYPVTLTVTDADGVSRAHTLQQRVLAPLAPTFSNSPATPNEVQSASFNDNTPSPASGPIVERKWTWGDGSAPTVTTSGSAAHTYADNGTYSVTLEIRDAWGQVSTTTRNVTVANVAPTVQGGPDWRWREDRALTLTPTTADVAGANDPVTCTWSFGDGTPDGTTCAFNHVYATPGTYSAVVTARDGDGGQATDTVVVEVIEQELPSGGGGSGGAAGTGAGKAARTYQYTLDDDFELGTMLNVNHDAPGSNQLQLNKEAKPFPFVYLAASGRGTALRIDVNTGTILGEYWTSPDGRAKNPSRTTVDKLGNVWVTNRDESETRTLDGINTQWGSATRIGLVVGGTRTTSAGAPDPNGEYLKAPFEYNTCVDRNGDGLIRTSRGRGNILSWSNAGGVDHDGGADTAADECIQLYVRVRGINTRTVAIDAENDAWIGGANSWHEEVDGETGRRVPGTAFSLGCGGYGGLIDGNGVLWSARYNNGLLRYDTKTRSGVCLGNGHGDYGLGVDPVTGHIWHTNLGGNLVVKLNPAATTHAAIELGRYQHGNHDAQGVAVDAKGSVWVSHALWGAPTIGRVRTDGVFLGKPWLGPNSAGATGVAVDANGKVWAANYATSNASRIDPEIGQRIGGTVPSGWYDMTVDMGSGANPYNYSDMTGSVAIGAASPSGFWSIKQDAGTDGTVWKTISWDGSTPGGTTITVEARAADAQTDLPSTPFRAVTDAAALSGIVGRFIEVRATLQTTDPNATPILTDIRISANTAPVAGDVAVSTPEDTPVAISLPASDADGDELTLTHTQPSHGTFDGTTYSPEPGYEGPDSFTYTATDPAGDSDAGEVTITVTGVDDVVNDVPTAIDGGASALEDGPAVTVDLTQLVSDTETSDADLTYTVVSAPDTAKATLTPGEPNGHIVLAPAADFAGDVTFTYSVTDRGEPAGCAPAGRTCAAPETSETKTFTLSVVPVNDAPRFAKGFDQSVEEDAPAQTVPAWASAISAGPADEAAQVVSFEVVGNDNPDLFAVTPVVSADGTLTYTPKRDTHGTATVALRAVDDGGTANGGDDTSEIQQLTITVAPVNDVPVAEDGSGSTDEDGSSVAVDLTELVRDVETADSRLRYDIVSGPDSAAGTLTSTGPGTYDFAPAPDFNGDAVLTYRVTDRGDPDGCASGAGCADAESSVLRSFRIAVRPVNDAPTAADTTYAVDEDSGDLAVDLTGEVADLETSDADLAYTVVQGPAAREGTLTPTAPGQFTFTPAADFFGTTGFTYTVTDRGDTDGCGPVSGMCAAPETSATRTVTITVAPVNDAPSFVAGADQTTDEDSAPVVVDGWAGAISSGPANEAGQEVAFDLTANTNPALFASPPTVGADGTLTYTPAPDAHGSATLAVRLRDGGGTDNGGLDTSPPHLLSITVTPVNDVPTAQDGAAALDEDADAVQIDLRSLVGDLETGDDDLAYSIVSGLDAGSGTLERRGPGQYAYHPAADFNGTAGFTYRVTDRGDPDGCTTTVACDTTHTSDPRTFVLTVRPVNDRPTAADAAVLLAEDGPATTIDLRTWVDDVETSDADLTYSLLSGPDVTAGSLVETAPGRFSFLPARDYNGTTELRYTVTDRGDPDGCGALSAACGDARTSEARTVAITVTPVNDVPWALDGAETTDEDGAAVPIDLTALAGDTETPDSGLTYTVVGAPPAAAGSLAETARGRLEFTPSPDFNGSTTLTYRVTDRGDPDDCGAAGTSCAEASSSALRTVDITVRPVNDAPAFAPGLDQTVDEDSPAQTVVAWAGSITAGPADEAGQQVTLEIVENSNPALFSAGPDLDDGTLTYTPAPDAFGSAVLAVRARDDGGTDHGGSDTSPVHRLTIVVLPVNDAPVLSVTVDGVVATGVAAAYSDAVPTVTLSASDVDDPGSDLVLGVDGPGLPAGLVLTVSPGSTAVPSAAEPGTRLATISGAPAVAAGEYLRTVRVTDGGSPAGEALRPLTIAVTEETMTFGYTGQNSATTNGSGGTADVLVSALVSEQQDAALGALRPWRDAPVALRMRFTVYSDNVAAPVLPACTVPVEQSEAQLASGSGSAACTFPGLREGVYSVRSEILENGYYTTSVDTSTISVTDPAAPPGGGNGFITGGGWFTDPGTRERSSFGFNARTQKSGKLHGGSNYVSRRRLNLHAMGIAAAPDDVRSYDVHVKSTALSGLQQKCSTTAGTEPCWATFSGSATVSAVDRTTGATYALGPDAIGGSPMFQVDVTDTGEPGTQSAATADRYAIRVWTSRGELYRVGSPRTTFTGVPNGEQVVLSGGNVQAHNRK